MTELFRKEAVDHSRGRLYGTVTLPVPFSWQIVSWFMFFTLTVACLFLVTASYTRTEDAPGEIVAKQGVAAVTPLRPGIVTAIHVVDDQRVTAGTPLVTIRAEDALLSGQLSSSQMQSALAEQDAHLAKQAELVLQAQRAEAERVEVEKRGLADQLEGLRLQMDLQKTLIATAQGNLEKARTVAENGFISKNELDARETSVISRQQQLAQLQQTAAQLRSQLYANDRAIEQSEATAGAQVDLIQANRTALAQQMIQTDASAGFTITSPIDGRITALTAKVGQEATPSQQLLMVVPNGAQIRAHIHVPVSAIAFVKPGQRVSIALDSFPYQEFGTLAGRVEAVSRATDTAPKQGPDERTYLVVVKLDNTSLNAFGTAREILPGMTLTARIATEKLTLFQWLFQPIFAVKNR
jgi:membrane fusion protein